MAASCAFPSLFPPQPLIAKSRDGAFVPWQPEGKLGPRRWRDGSLENDLPMKELSELFNVNYFLVSQTNPHIVPILRAKKWFASLGPFCATAAQSMLECRSAANVCKRSVMVSKHTLSRAPLRLTTCIASASQHRENAARRGACCF